MMMLLSNLRSSRHFLAIGVIIILSFVYWRAAATNTRAPFNLRFRRDWVMANDDAGAHEPILFFTDDALDEPRVTTKELLQSFREIALREKALAAAEMRKKQGGKRPVELLNSRTYTVADDHIVL